MGRGNPPFLLLKKENEGEFSTLGVLEKQIIPRTILDAMEVRDDLAIGIYRSMLYASFKTI